MIRVRVDWRDGDTIEKWDEMCEWVYDTFGNTPIESTAEYAIFSFAKEKDAIIFTLKYFYLKMDMNKLTIIDDDETAQDIFESWKNRKFIVIENLDLDIPKNRCIIILSDIMHWNENYDELKEWCYQHGGIVKGMTVEIDYELAPIFVLRWS